MLAAGHALHMLDLGVGELLHEAEVERANLRMRRRQLVEDAVVRDQFAAAALELSRVGKPPEIHFGWSDENPVAANIGFLLFGEGNVPWMVRELVRRAEPDPQRQPKVVIG